MSEWGKPIYRPWCWINGHKWLEKGRHVICTRCDLLEMAAALELRIIELRDERDAFKRTLDYRDIRVAELEAEVERYEQWFSDHASVLASHGIGGFVVVNPEASTTGEQP